MSGHTPKPWFAVRYANWFNIQNRDEYQDAANLLDADDVGEEQAASNATLMKSAPDLLEACESMLHRFGHLDCDPGKREAVDLAVAAVKKANGEVKE